MAKTVGISGTSILCTIDQFAEELLNLKCIGKAPQYQHKEHCQNLAKRPYGFEGKKLVLGSHERVAANWEKAKYHNPSSKNWRFEPRREISGKNTDPEIKLERAIVNLEINSPPDYVWVNQVPTSSGLVHPRADGPRHIDLVHQLGVGTYEFIELKVDSNNPLYAAMEILQYGILYIFCRSNKQICDAVKKDKRLLEAEAIELKVLAPHDYYKGSDLGWLEDEINVGLEHFLKESTPRLKMSFRFEAFPKSFDPCSTDKDALRKALKDRKPVDWT